jgi:hypothetical protein
LDGSLGFSAAVCADDASEIAFVFRAATRDVEKYTDVEGQGGIAGWEIFEA